MISPDAATCRPLPRRGPVLALTIGLAGSLLLGACGDHVPAPASGPAPQASSPTAQVDLPRLQGIAKEPGAWLTTGRDTGKTHFSPLEQLNRQTAARLGFAWE